MRASRIANLKQFGTAFAVATQNGVLNVFQEPQYLQK